MLPGSRACQTCYGDVTRMLRGLEKFGERHDKRAALYCSRPPAEKTCHEEVNAKLYRQFRENCKCVTKYFTLFYGRFKPKFNGNSFLVTYRYSRYHEELRRVGCVTCKLTASGLAKKNLQGN